MNLQLLAVCLSVFCGLAGADKAEWLLQKERETKERAGWDDATYDKYTNTLNYLNQIASYKFTGKVVESSPPDLLDTSDPENPTANFFEGDIVMTKEQMDEVVKAAEEDSLLNVQSSPDYDDTILRAARRKRKLMSSTRNRWPTTINYRIDTASGVDANAVTNGVNLWSQLTCLRFNRITSQSGDYMEFFRGSGCYSNVGRIGGRQTVSIGFGCTSIGIVTHEIGHALGFWHEQSRPDRDNYIKIEERNIDANRLGNFLKRSYSDVTLMGIPYDYGSVMHYGSTAFRTSGDVSIRTLDSNAQNTIGQRTGLSFYDVKFINNAYCARACSRQLSCQHNGYTDPKNCNVCRCPDGFSGKLCQTAASTTTNCGTLERYVGAQSITLSKSASGRCNWLLKTDAGRKLIFTVSSFSFSSSTTCTRNYLEIKSAADLANTGARMCKSRPSTITSVSNEAMVIYLGSSSSNSFRLSVRASGRDPTGPTPSPITTTQRPTPGPTPAPTTTTTTRPPPAGQWNQWGAWTDCTGSCGACGVRIRRRSCGGTGCLGLSVVAERCAFQVCAGSTPCCSPWYVGQNGVCTNTGPVGTTPAITTPSTTPLPTTTTTTTTPQPTQPPTTPTALGWTTWGEWTGCTASCGSCGVRLRRRECQSPAGCTGGSGIDAERCAHTPCDILGFKSCCRPYFVGNNGQCTNEEQSSTAVPLTTTPKATPQPTLPPTTTPRPSNCQVWSEWTPCQVAKCGGCGVKYRARICLVNGKSTSEHERVSCNFNACNSSQPCCNGLEAKNGVCVKPAGWA